MKYLIILPGIVLLFFNLSQAQNFSAFPDDPPRPWLGAGVSYPDIGISLQAYPRSVPILIRPQVDFGMFQSHGHAINGGKLMLAYVSPFTVVGIGRTYIGAIGGYKVDRINDRLEINGNRVLEEEKIFLWGGVLGEMIELYDNLFLAAEVRFLNKDIEHIAIDPRDAFETREIEDFRTTWMVGVQYYFW